MTNKEILQKSIEKAEKNGFNFIQSIFETMEKYEIKKCNNKYIDFYTYSKTGSKAHSYSHINELIFNHDFAKAFWGIKGIWCPKCNTKYTHCDCEFNATICDYWKYHLQQMVLEKEPLKYIEKFLKDENGIQNSK